MLSMDALNTEKCCFDESIDNIRCGSAAGQRRTKWRRHILLWLLPLLLALTVSSTLILLLHRLCSLDVVPSTWPLGEPYLRSGLGSNKGGNGFTDACFLH